MPGISYHQEGSSNVKWHMNTQKALKSLQGGGKADGRAQGEVTHPVWVTAAITYEQLSHCHILPNQL